MENDRKKWVNLSLVAAAVLLGYIITSLLHHLSGTFDLEARIRNFELWVLGAGVLAGILLFVLLSRHQKTNQFMDEVALELSRVTWPTQKDTSRATIVVVIMVLISGAILGLFDTLWTWALKFVL